MSVVNSRIVLRVFCVVLNQNVAASIVLFDDHAGFTQYALYKNPLLIYPFAELVKNGLIALWVIVAKPLSNFIVLSNPL